MSTRNINRLAVSNFPEAIDPSTKDKVLNTYEGLGVEIDLLAYMNNRVGERTLDETLSRFSQYLADFASSEDYLDISVIRFGVDHLTDSMDAVCRQTLEPPMKKGIRGLLAKAGIGHQPPHRTYVRKLDDEYWSKQFLKQHRDGSLTGHKPGESDQEYLERYIDGVVRGFIFAPFTYVRP